MVLKSNLDYFEANLICHIGTVKKITIYNSKNTIIRYLGINLTKDAQYLHMVNYKILLQDIKEGLSKCKKYNIH